MVFQVGTSASLSGILSSATSMAAKRRNKQRKFADSPQPGSRVEAARASGRSEQSLAAFLTKWQKLFVILFLLGACFQAFSPLLENDTEFYKLDDDAYVYANPQITRGITWEGLWWDLTAFHSHNWHPLTWLSLQVDAGLFGVAPWGFRFTNVLLHTAAGMMLFVALSRMTKQVWPSALTAALFALHPLHVESVAWIAERKDVLSGLFLFLALWAYARYVERPGWRRYLGVTLLLACGLMAKPMLVTAPFLLLLLDYWPLGRMGGDRSTNAEAGAARQGLSIRFLILEKLPWLALSFVSVLLTLHAQRQIAQPMELFSLESRLANSVIAYARYLWHMIWPLNLTAFYPHAGNAWSVAEFTASLGLLVLITGGVWFFRCRRYLTVGWLWYVGMLVPVIGIVQVGMQAMADRYSYLPLVGIFIMLSWGLAGLIAWRPVLRNPGCLLAGAVLLACIALSNRQAEFWHDGVASWRRYLAVSPESQVISNGLEQALGSKGTFAEAVRYFQTTTTLEPAVFSSLKNLGQAYVMADKAPEALAGYEKILAILAARSDPHQEEVHLQLGQLCLKVPGGQQEARKHFDAVLVKHPESREARLGAATADILAGEPERAREVLAALASDPSSAQDKKQLALIESRLGEAQLLLNKTAEALPNLERAVALDPRLAAAHYYLAYGLQEQGKEIEAQAEYQRAKGMDPKWPSQTTLESLLMASHPEAKARNGRLAVLRMRIAAAATEEKDPLVQIVLAAAYAETGQFDEAIATVGKAIELAREQKQPELEQQGREHLKLYQKKQPFRARR
jgi:tetratricopeptide (TPR) repeat protein